MTALVNKENLRMHAPAGSLMLAAKMQGGAVPVSGSLEMQQEMGMGQFHHVAARMDARFQLKQPASSLQPKLATENACMHSRVQPYKMARNCCHSAAWILAPAVSALKGGEEQPFCCSP
jgi:hypothetical protein